MSTGVYPPQPFAVSSEKPTNHCPEFRRSLAVVIGINDYANGVPRLSTPVNDAGRLAKILEDEHGYEVCLLTENVSKARLQTLFQEQLQTEVNEQDRILVYFAGHGIALDGEDGPEGFLIPQDAYPEDRNTFLAMTELYEGLNRLPCRHLLAILDCCFAGAFRWSTTRHLRLAMPEILHKERYDRFVRDPAWQVLTSAAYDQQALDVLAGRVVGTRELRSETDGHHSPFALALFEALAGAGDLIPKAGGDGVITAAELYLYLRDYVEIESEERVRHHQTPGIWPLRKHDKGEYIFLVPGHEHNLPPAPPLTVTNNPYCGLQPYDEEHAALFFGRTGLIKQLAECVQSQPFTVVLGASGTGKSSLVKAGLIPYLKQVATPNPIHCLTPLRLGGTPLRALADLLAAELPRATSNKATATPLEEVVIEKTIETQIKRWFALYPEHHLLLSIDQFEELITLCRVEQTRLRFLQLLAKLLQDHRTHLHITLTLRTDFEPQFIDSPLATEWQAVSQVVRFVVPPLTQAELRDVIEEPAAKRVLFFDPPELVEQLVDEVSQTPGALPLLSFTLSELYLKYLKRQEQAQQDGETIERSLTEADYQALGGVIGSLRTRADEVYANLSHTQQQTMQRVMLRMMAVDGGELARRRVLITELIYQDQDENARVTAIVDQMVDARLLIRGGGTDIDGDNIPDTYVEPAHDALIRAWDKLLLWKQRADEYLPLQRRLTQAAQEWQRAATVDKDGLLWDNDPGLPQVLPGIIRQSDLLDTAMDPWQAFWPSTQVAEAPSWLNQVETRFITASVKQRSTIRRRLTLTALGVFIGLLGLTLAALIQRNIAQNNAAESQSNALASSAQQAIQNNDHDLGIALALEANQVRSTALAINALAASAYVPGTQAYFDQHDDEIIQVVLRADGRTALSVAQDGVVALWDTATQAIRQQLTGQQVITITQVAYSPNGDTALLGAVDGSIVVWDLASGAILHQLHSEQSSEITALAYSADGHTALSGDNEGILMLWDLATGAALRQLATHSGGVSALALSPDGLTALSGGYDANVNLWNLADGQQIWQIPRHRRRILTVAYGRTATVEYAISGSTDGAVGVWDLATAKQLQVLYLNQHTQAIGSIAIAPDGVTVASGAWDGSIRLWDLQVNELIGSFVGHRAPVISLTFAADSRHLLSGSRDSTVRLWDTRGPGQLAQYSVEQRLPSGGPTIEAIQNLDLNRNERLALSGAFNTALVWNVDTGDVTHRFELRKMRSVVHTKVGFQITAHNPMTGTQDGDGIAHVEMSVLDPMGHQVYEHKKNIAAYCAFPSGSQGCEPWNLARADYRWPVSDGQEGLGPAIQNGQHTLRAVVYASDGTSTTVESLIEVQIPDSAASTPLWTTAQFTNTGTVSVTAPTNLNVEVAEAGEAASGLSAVALDATDGLALISDGNNVLSWQWDTDEKTLFARGHREKILHIDYNGERGSALSVSEDGEVVAWNLQTGQPLWSRQLAHDATLWSMAFSKDGSFAVAGYEDRSVILWELTTGAARQPFVDHQDAVYSVAISPDEQTILSGSADRSVILWDLASGAAIRRFEGHSLPVRTVAFDPAGTTILSGSEDRTVRLWDRKSGAEIFRFAGHTSTLQNARYLPSGSRILSRATDGALILWELPMLDGPKLVDWTRTNRYVRALTCDERLLYLGELDCGVISNAGS